jgi:acyl-coenzyme A synthetase/AMP-(fatty) acid ligase
VGEDADLGPPTQGRHQGQTGEELRAHVAQHLAGYKAPRSVEFVAELPGTGS